MRFLWSLRKSNASLKDSFPGMALPPFAFSFSSPAPPSASTPACTRWVIALVQNPSQKDIVTPPSLTHPCDGWVDPSRRSFRTLSAYLRQDRNLLLFTDAHILSLSSMVTVQIHERGTVGASRACHLKLFKSETTLLIEKYWPTPVPHFHDFLVS